MLHLPASSAMAASLTSLASELRHCSYIANPKPRQRRRAASERFPIIKIYHSLNSWTVELLMAAARLLVRRLASCVSTIRRSSSPILSIEGEQFALCSTANIPSRYLMAITARRGIVTQSSSSIQSSNKAEEHETNVADAKPDTDVATMIENVRSNGTAENSTTFSNFKISKHHNLAMIFSCKVCETRSMKTMCRESYEMGVVVARCGGCNNLHLIADHLGWSGEPGTIEELLPSRGEEVKKGSFDTLNLTLKDIVGKMQCKDVD